MEIIHAHYCLAICCTVLRMQACNVIEVKCNVTLKIGEGGIFLSRSHDEISPFSRVNGD